MRFAVLALVLATTANARAQATPKSGTEVLQRMHDAYAGKWYRTLTFVQKTTQYKKDGTTAVSTWFESLRQVDPTTTQLRIDVGDPAIGNGMLYTADSTWRVRAGKITATQGEGNEFLPLIEGVYMQPVARTVAQLQGTKIDMQRVTKGRWQDRAVWIVGASSPADTTSPQFWIDVDRNVVVRMLLSPGGKGPMLDIHLDGYVPLEKGWLATKVVMTEGGQPRQKEEYSGWKANVPLRDDLFSVDTWTTAEHWAKGRN